MTVFDEGKEATYEGEEEEVIETEEEVEEEETEEEPLQETLTKDEVTEIVKSRLARDRRKREKEFADKLGVPLEQAREYIEAGRSVSQASGMTPAQIRQKIAEQNVQQGGPQSQQALPSEDSIRQELQELKGMFSEEREEKLRAQEAATAKKEFGTLYDKYSDDIEDYAEDNGLSLVDAAAVVLRPKLREYFETQAETKRKVTKKKRVDGTSEGAGGGEVDVSTKLTPAEKDIAQKMGLTLQEYYENKK